MHREISSHSNIIRRVLDIMKAISSGLFYYNAHAGKPRCMVNYKWYR